MTRTIFGAALALALISVLVPLVVIIVIELVAIFLGLGLQTVTLIALITVPAISYLVYRRFNAKLGELAFNKKKDWERVGSILILIFTILGATFAIQSFYGQTITQSSCINPPNVNVTSPNCKTIQTASVPESTMLGPWVTLLLDVILLVIVVFGVWTAVLYTFRKTGIE
jgi:hypothetical protein